jgi:hypothetical protein
MVETDLDLDVVWHYGQSHGLESAGVSGTAMTLFGGGQPLDYAVNDAIWATFDPTPTT